VMMNHSMKSQFNVSSGTVIEGKWHKNRYIILKELGYGANGIVYLSNYNNQQVAIKMSDNGMSVTSEVNVLKSFAKVQGSALGPSLLDVDDWSVNGKNISFYAMEYIHGPDLMSFIKQKGPSWTPVLILQLLNDLAKLHDSGWVFGDLKPENLIVTGPPPKVRCIDVGGTTLKGRAIKEFTEFYDRGYWNLGTRKADPGYDLFAVAMIMMNTAYPNRFTKKIGGVSELKEKIHAHKELFQYEDVISSALTGKYVSAKEMRQALLESMNKQDVHQSNTRVNRRNSSTMSAGNTATRAQQNVHKKKSGGFFETACIVAIISCLYFLYIYGQLI
jgi:predicted Ser/Thr protein kinase